MKKNTKGEGGLSPYQIQATRLNGLEYRRLQQNLDLMQEDLKMHLTRLQRQAHHIRYHYTNVVRVLKPNPGYQLWKEGQDETESIKVKHISKPKIPSLDEISSESTRPLLLLLANPDEKPVEPMINFSTSFLRPSTSPVKKHLPDLQRKDALATMFHERTNNPIRSKPSERDAVAFLPAIKPTGPRKIEHGKSAPVKSEKMSNLDALYRMALQNQTAYKSVNQTHINERKLTDRQFARQHHVLKSTIRSAGIVN